MPKRRYAPQAQVLRYADQPTATTKAETFEIGGAETVSFNDLLTGFAERIGKVKPLCSMPRCR